MTRINDLLQQRYGHAPDTLAHANGAAGAVIEQLLAHRSVRAFLDTPLPAGTLETLVAAAQSAASSSNLQTWSVVAVRDAERKSRLSEWCGQQAHIRQVPLFLVWVADLSRLHRTADRLGRRADANRFLEMFLVAAVDASLAAQNAVLAAEALGLGTVYIGALRNHADAVAAELALPPLAFPLFGLCVGHPDPSRPAAIKPRLSPSTVLHHERYDAAGEAAAVADYDELIQAFQQSQGMPPLPWSAQATQRVATAQSLSGRDRLAHWLRAQGFGLE
ncbi:NADPH-dependent oxidoreductase [Aquincola tertiaricarbonis]|uniref:NADPH-dependent oxidoreductase n=1 Tax=Aquincola tertiaricarbonis TaxID=391953 RepID=A0ABY4S8T0_AQUTE|nr:NADPH-dependent oxidoreductase [Aquincola tertiaricarbonis]URI08610.1 NADPH-dependent oxidoreductase [Aquincola tertiaricarbonis]